MSEKTFYDFKGEPIGVKEFIELYEPYYFIENEKDKRIRHTQTARYVEKEIVAILKNGDIESRANLAKEMDLDTLAKSMYDNRNELKKLAVEKPQECLNWLRDITRENKIVGLGSVYLINLLFFLSHGKCPIYDRFAMASLRAYEEGLSPVEYKGKPPVKVPNLPDKNSKRFETICENGAYAEYIEKLDALGVDYKEDRRLDRALWVYGHAFEIEEGKCC